MSFLEAALLGILQGLTEFLPVSSSGHLVLGRHLLGTGGADPMAFDVALHLGTLAAVLAYFRTDIARLLAAASPGRRGERRELGMLALATLPIAAAGLLLAEPLAAAFASPLAAGLGLLVSAAFLASTRLLPPEGPGRGPGAAAALLIGLAQALAIMPGVSRSGATIVAALWLGLGRQAAARFAFLLALPAIAGATLLKFPALATLARGQALVLAAGVIMAALSGFAAIAVMMRAVQGGRLLPFALYCLVLGIAALVVGVG